MKKYDLCIPVIKSGCKYRKLALDYVKRYYSQYFNIVAPEIEEYNPSKARNLAVNTSTNDIVIVCLLYTSPSPRDLSTSRMPSSA